MSLRDTYLHEDINIMPPGDMMSSAAEKVYNAQPNLTTKSASLRSTWPSYASSSIGAVALGDVVNSAVARECNAQPNLTTESALSRSTWQNYTDNNLANRDPGIASGPQRQFDNPSTKSVLHQTSTTRSRKRVAMESVEPHVVQKKRYAQSPLGFSG